MVSADLQLNWFKYKHNKDVRARDALIVYYAYLVKITAGRLINYLPPGMEREDLTSAGVLGLIKAVDNFDTSRQVKFETYAIALIRGAILESLREDDWVPRTTRDRIKNLERTYMSLEMKLGRPATEEEVAEALGISLDDLQRTLQEANRTALLSFDEPFSVGGNGEAHNLADLIRDNSASPTLEVEMHQRRDTLARAIDRLPEREKLIVALYYYEGMTFKEIGKILSISESRSYQCHNSAVIRLRGYLTADVDLFEI